MIYEYTGLVPVLGSEYSMVLLKAVPIDSLIQIKCVEQLSRYICVHVGLPMLYIDYTI